MDELSLSKLKDLLSPLLAQLCDLIAKRGGELEPTLRRLLEGLASAFDALDLDGDRAERRAVYAATASAIAKRLGLAEAACLEALLALCGEPPRRGEPAHAPDAALLRAVTEALVTLKVVYRRTAPGAQRRTVEVWLDAGGQPSRTTLEQELSWDEVPSEARAAWIRTGASECSFTVYPKER